MLFRSQYVRPSTANTYNYEVTTAGTSGTAEPTWSTTLGGTTTDGTVTWTTVSMRGNNNIILGYDLQETANTADTLNIGNIINGNLVTGDVGIGTTTPQAKLDVAGNININTGSAYQYNGANVITAQISLDNYFFGGAGNLTMTGSYNTASGYLAFNSNTTGDKNVANGVYALYYNTTGYSNVANGYNTLGSNTDGYQNTANGYDARSEEHTSELQSH